MGVILACLLFGLVLLGASLGLAGGREGGTPLDRLQSVARGGLVAPEPGDSGGGGSGAEAPQPTPDPPPASTPPPASAPPASVPPDGGPTQSQYAGDG